MRFLILCGIAFFASCGAFAQNVALPAKDSFVGVSRLLTNDLLGDGNDRWRTGSYALSLTFGQNPTEDGLPRRLGALMEYRIRAELLTPENLARTVAFPDRPYVGVLGLGAFSHFTNGPVDFTLGAELNFVGPSTQLGALQDGLHDALGILRPQMLADQVPDAVHPTLFAAMHSDITLSERAKLRPFYEVQAGLENYVRLGADVIVGAGFQDAFFTRDPHTGHLVRNANAPTGPAWGFSVGGDVAYVKSSALLPVARGYQVEHVRPRLRAGLRYETERGGLFYGLTWLGKEFSGQTDSQVIGSIRAIWKF